MSNQPASSRPFEIAPQDRTPRQREIVERIENGPRGRVPINLRAWLHNPDFVDVADPFGLYVSQLAPITKRQKEIVVLTGARFWQAAYERHLHEGHALRAGLTAEQIARINAGESPDFADPLEQLTWELAFAIHSPGPVPAAVHERCMAVMGHAGVSNLIGLAGLYTMISMTLNFYDVAPPAAAPTDKVG
jgi:4-carboxymuconolactone decarboxylase